MMKLIALVIACFTVSAALGLMIGSYASGDSLPKKRGEIDPNLLISYKPAKLLFQRL